MFGRAHLQLAPQQAFFEDEVWSLANTAAVSWQFPTAAALHVFRMTKPDKPVGWPQTRSRSRACHVPSGEKFNKGKAARHAVLHAHATLKPQRKMISCRASSGSSGELSRKVRAIGPGIGTSPLDNTFLLISVVAASHRGSVARPLYSLHYGGK